MPTDLSDVLDEVLRCLQTLEERIDALRDEVEAMRLVLQGRAQELPKSAAYTIDEARVRISRRIDPRALSEELGEMLEDSRVMSRRALKRARDDELCPIKALSLPCGLRIMESDIRKMEAKKQDEARPESLNHL
jgi:hypothetical protein